MHFNLTTVVVLLLSLLTGNTLAKDCYNGGTTWADLGDDAAISQAFNSLCDKMSGTYKLHDNVSQGTSEEFIWSLVHKSKSLISKIMQIVNCENINGHHIQAAIWPNEGDTHDYNLVDLSLEGCIDYMNQVSPHGIHLGILVSGILLTRFLCIRSRTSAPTTVEK